MIVQTQRLLLREFEPADAETFYDLNLDPEVMRYTGDVAFASVEASRQFIHNYPAYRESGFGRWSVVLRKTGICIGWCGLKRHPGGMVDLGYRLARAQWNRGYATEASRACLDYGFTTLKLGEIVGRTARANLASIRVLEKIGMQFWKHAPCEGISDSVFYRVSAAEKR